MKRSIRQTDLRPNAQRDVSDELRFHLEMRTQEFIEAGMTPDDARLAAAKAFGDVNSIDAELRAVRSKRTRMHERRDWMQDFVADVGFAIRTLRNNAAFTMAALATLALGIGATTAVFTVVNGVLLRPLPYADPSRAVMVWLRSTQTGDGGDLPLSPGFYFDITTGVKSFARVAAFRSWPYTLNVGGDAEQVAGSRATASLFPLMGVRPILGRALVDADAESGAPPVVVLGYDLWKRRFGANSEIVGRRVDLGGQPFTVVGVMPSGFAFPRGAELISGLQFGLQTELWTPMTFTPADRKQYGTLNIAVIGRLVPGVTAATAAAEASAQLHSFLKANAPKWRVDYRLVDLPHQAGDRVRRGLLFLMGAVGFVLFIACANVTNLLIARTSARHREFAVRAALGAGRGRIARQLVTENILLAICGTALGVALSVWATRAMLALVPGSMPRASDVRLDWRVALGAGIIATAVGGVFGIVSTLQIRVGQLATTIPGVRAAGATSALPLTGAPEGGSVAIVGEPPPEAGQAPHAEYAVVEGNYFQALGIKLVAGRTFDNTDRTASAPVVIVNREFVRRHLKGGPAIDRQLRCYFDFSNGGTRTIIGVVDDVRSTSLDAPMSPQVYVPQQQMSYPGLTLTLRTQNDPNAIVPALKAELKALDSRLALSKVRTMDAVFDQSLARQRFSMTIIAVFAGSALVLAIVGLYGVIALSVGQRRREIGVRMALGARPVDVFRLVVGEGLTITLAGALLGVLGAFALSRVVTSLLFGVSATDAPIYGASAVGIIFVTLVATFIPARRATRVDPTSALKSD